MAHDSIETVRVDPEAWEIAFKPYAMEANANFAYDLARLFMVLKQYLQCQPPDIRAVVAALDEAAQSESRVPSAAIFSRLN